MKPEQTQAISDVAREMYAIAASKGFHDGDVPNEVPRDFGAWCANLHSEVSELWEAYRRHQLDKQCDKPVDLTNAEEELADIVIRAMDTAVALGVDLGKAIEVKARYNESRAHRHGGKAA
jgi:NTP pyrophosphatase (non-canonical NTP hydrolase)